MLLRSLLYSSYSSIIPCSVNNDIIPADMGQEGGKDWSFEIFLTKLKVFECSLANPDHEQVIDSPHYLCIYLHDSTLCRYQLPLTWIRQH